MRYSAAVNVVPPFVDKLSHFT